MRLKPKSLQGRLLLGILATLIMTLALGGLVVYRVVDGHLRKEFDAALAEKLSFYQTTFILRRGEPKWRMGAAEWTRETNPENADFVQFWFLPSGRLIFRSPSLYGSDLPQEASPQDAPQYRDGALFDKTKIRVITRKVYPSVEAGETAVPVQAAVARDTASLTRALDEVKWFLIKTAVCTILILMAGTRWIIRRGVKPVAALAGQIEAMPLVDSDARFGLPGAPSEIQPVVGRLNALMDRVGSAIEHERMFTSNAAHELRNPLAAIRSRVELALSRTRSVEEYEETLDGILESQTGMQRVVDHLLLLARLESGHRMTDWAQESTSLSVLLRKAWRTVFETASARRIKVTWQVTEPTAELILPVSLVSIVLRNLFDNAAGYSPEGGTVHIAAEAPAGLATISVSNTNPGLTADQLESTFAPFWRGDPNASGHRGNAGIGLALVRRIMETMQGSAKATLLDDRVVYTLEFPVQAAAASVSPLIPALSVPAMAHRADP